MDILGEIASALVDKMVSAFVVFCRERDRRNIEAEKFRTELLQVFSRVENLISYNRITEFFSDAQLRGIFRRFSMPDAGRDALNKKQLEIMDFINPSVGEVSEIKTFAEALCRIVFQYANPVDEPSRALLIRIEDGVGHTVQEEIRNAREGIEQRIADQTPSRSMQILPIEQFIRTKSASTINATLDHTIFHREAEINQSMQLLSDSRAMVLSGFPGVGKTRLALEILKKVSETEDRQALCIHGNGAELYYELQRELKNYGRYILLVDDANEFSYLPYILDYLAPNAGQIDAKAILTVRNYAKDKVIMEVQRVVATTEIKLEPLKWQDIVDLVHGEFPEFTNFAVEQIAHIAQGNPRIALMAAQCVQKDQSLSAIRNATELYDRYYQTVLLGNPIWNSRTNICTVAVIAMASVVDMGRIESLIPLLTACSVTQQAMQDSVKFLHHAEIADLCLDRAVKIPDQCLSDYLIKKVLLEERWIPLRTFIEVMFDHHQHALIRTINMLVNVFHQDAIVQEVATEVGAIWKDWEANHDPRLWEFLKAFHQTDPIRVFKLLKDMIDSQEQEEFDTRSVNFAKEKNNRYCSDDFLKILSGYRYEHTVMVVQLIFRYYLKRPSLYTQVYHCCCELTCPNEVSYHAGLCIQNDLTDEMHKLILERSDDNTVLICGRIALHMLGLWFSETYSRNEKTVVFTKIRMIETQASRRYRNKLWEIIISVFDDATLQPEIMNFLQEYGWAHEELNAEVILGDWPSIRRLITEKMCPDSLSFAKTLEKLKSHLTEFVPVEQFDFLEAFFQAKAFKMSQMLLAEDEDLEYRERRAAKRSQLVQYVSGMTEAEIPMLLSTAKELAKGNSAEAWRLGENFKIILQSLDGRPDIQLALTTAYIQAGAPMGFLPTPCLENLIKHLTFSALWEKLRDADMCSCECIVFQMLSIVPDDQISQEHLLMLKKYFLNHPPVTSSPNRNLQFLMRYQTKDPEISLFVLRCILEQGKQNPFLLRIYGYFAFHENAWLLEACKDEPNILCEFYMMVTVADEFMDYDGTCFIALINKYPEFFDRFVKNMVDHDGKRDAYTEKLSVLVDEDDYLFRVPEIIRRIIGSEQIFIYEKGDLLAKILTGHRTGSNISRINDCLYLLIDDSKDDLHRIEVLFRTLDDLPRECRQYGIVTWLRRRPSQETLEKVSLGRRFFSWTGSPIPGYEEEIRFFEGILSEFKGVDDIDAAKAIGEQIASLKETIRRETLDEFMTDR